MTKKMGWWASNQATLYFDDCCVPTENMIGVQDKDFIQIMHNFNYERLSLVAAALGMMKVCFEDSVAWAQERETFGNRLIDHQLIRHKLANMSAKIDLVQSNLWAICANIENGDMPVAEICKAKFSATKALEFCASEAMQILGGAG